jgi:hypothetical protein
MEQDPSVRRLFSSAGMHAMQSRRSDIGRGRWAWRAPGKGQKRRAGLYGSRGVGDRNATLHLEGCRLWVADLRCVCIE